MESGGRATGALLEWEAHYPQILKCRLLLKRAAQIRRLEFYPGGGTGLIRFSAAPADLSLGFSCPVKARALAELV